MNIKVSNNFSASGLIKKLRLEGIYSKYDAVKLSVIIDIDSEKDRDTVTDILEEWRNAESEY